MKDETHCGTPLTIDTSFEFDEEFSSGHSSPVDYRANSKHVVSIQVPAYIIDAILSAWNVFLGSTLWLVNDAMIRDLRALVITFKAIYYFHEFGFGAIYMTVRNILSTDEASIASNIIHDRGFDQNRLRIERLLPLVKDEHRDAFFHELNEFEEASYSSKYSVMSVICIDLIEVLMIPIILKFTVLPIIARIISNKVHSK